MKKYRKDLEKLIGKEFIIEGTVSARGFQVTKTKYNTVYKMRTMCLENIKCGLRENNKLKCVAKVDHAWLKEDISVIVRDKTIKKGDTVRLIAEVTEYNYTCGTEQLGLVQSTTRKNYKVK